MANPATVAFNGASAHSAMTLGLPPHLIEMASNAIKDLTSPMPHIGGQERMPSLNFSTVATSAAPTHNAPAAPGNGHGRG